MTRFTTEGKEVLCPFDAERRCVMKRGDDKRYCRQVSTGACAFPVHVTAPDTHPTTQTGRG